MKKITHLVTYAIARTLWYGLALVSIMLSLAGPLQAQDKPLSQGQQDELIDRAEAALMALKTLQADFIQFASDGSVAEGRVYFRRPFQLRIDYTNPPDLSFVTSRVWIHVDDKIDKQVTSYPISQSPFAPLLKRDITFRTEDVSVSARKRDGVVSITLEKRIGEGAGRLTLEFESQNWTLRRWIIADAAGIETQVTLQNPIYDLSLANKLFGIPSYPNASEN